MASVIPASSQPSPEEAASPGIAAMASRAPITAAGTAVTTVPRASRTVTCRSDPPRARSMVSSSPRRTTTMRAASRITAAAITIRLTDSSSSTVSTPAWVLRNSDTSAVSGMVTLSVSVAGASGPVSAGVTVLARLRALYSPWAWSALSPPTASGNSQPSSMPGPLNALCIAASWSGSAMTPAAQ